MLNHFHKVLIRSTVITQDQLWPLNSFTCTNCGSKLVNTGQRYSQGTGTNISSVPSFCYFLVPASCRSDLVAWIQSAVRYLRKLRAGCEFFPLSCTGNRSEPVGTGPEYSQGTDMGLDTECLSSSCLLHDLSTPEYRHRLRAGSEFFEAGLYTLWIWTSISKPRISQDTDLSLETGWGSLTSLYSTWVQAHGPDQAYCRIMDIGSEPAVIFHSCPEASTEPGW